VHATLDALAIALYVQIDDFLPARSGPGHPPKLSDAELITLAVCQMLLGLPNDRQFLALARYRLAHLFPYLLKQPGYNKRVRRLGPQIAQAITHLAQVLPSFGDNLRLLDSTPVPCGQSRETARRSELAGSAGYGYCHSHSRYFWGYRLYLLCAPDGMPIRFELFPGQPRRARRRPPDARRPGPRRLHRARRQGLRRRRVPDVHGRPGRNFVRPDRKNEPVRYGALGAIRQWIESVFWTCKGQLTLERHGGRTHTGLAARVALRLLALAAALWHNQLINQPGRHLSPYTH
jgi:hypothetical protein